MGWVTLTISVSVACELRVCVHLKIRPVRVGGRGLLPRLPGYAPPSSRGSLAELWPFSLRLILSFTFLPLVPFQTIQHFSHQHIPIPPHTQVSLRAQEREPTSDRCLHQQRQSTSSLGVPCCKLKGHELIEFHHVLPFFAFQWLLLTLTSLRT
jgi:hypothetical protein